MAQPDKANQLSGSRSLSLSVNPMTEQNLVHELADRHSGVAQQTLDVSRGHIGVGLSRATFFERQGDDVGFR